MLKRIKKQRRLTRFQTPEARVTARIAYRDGAYALTFGDKTVILRDIDTTHPTQEAFDFAGFALCAVSMSQNIAIDVDFPVTQSFEKRLRELTNAYRLWSIDVLAPLRLHLGEVVEDPARKDAGGMLCLSGGLDSMSAAVEAKRLGDTASALLIAGADYKGTQQSGFVELKERVTAVAQLFEFDVHIVETNIRQVGFNWSMAHSFNLAFCLHRFSGTHGFGSYAQDNTAVQDIFRAPWGNMNVLPQMFSTEQFPMRTYGTALDRVAKLRSVLEYDEGLLKHLSVCYTDKSIGGNCGKCPKCIQLRATLVALDCPDYGLFQDTIDIAKVVRNFKVPKKLSEIRGRMSRTSELVNALPDGETRDAFVSFENRLRARFHRMMPHMDEP